MSRRQSALVALFGLVAGVLLGLLRRRPAPVSLPEDVILQEEAGGHPRVEGPSSSA